MDMKESFEVTDKVAADLEPYVTAMMKASGLNEFDATTSVLFAISTHLDSEQYPILVYLGARATGKSAAMKQLFPLCKDSKLIHGKTYATQRDALTAVRTAFVDENDIVDGNAQLTGLYTDRYLRENGYAEVYKKGNYGIYEMKRLDIFGATVMAKRTSIADVALKSRAIIVHTIYRLRGYDSKDVGDVSQIASAVAAGVKLELSKIGEVDRVYQTWSSLLAIANQLGMTEWRKEADNIMAEEAEALAGGRGYEPADAIIQAINILARDEVNSQRTDKSIRISEVVRTLKEEFAVPLKHSQVSDAAKAKGFEIGTLKGYPVIKVKKDLLDKLLPETG